MITIKLIVAVWLSLFVLIAHFGVKDKRKGKHGNQSNHGNRYRSEGGKRILAKKGGRKDRAADKGRKLSKPSKPKRSELDDLDDDDPFAEDYGEDEPKSKEDEEREKYEAKLIKELKKAERGRLHDIIHEAGGLQTRDDLRNEYSEISNTLKRKDGTPGDEMAEYLATYYPEFGVGDERDLIDFLVAA